MATWLTVLLAVLALPVLGTLLTLTYRQYETGHSEQKELRQEGAEILARIEEIVRTFVPSEAFEPVSETSMETWQRWVQQRERLRSYGHAHPDPAVGSLSNLLIDAVNRLGIRVQQYETSPVESVSQWHGIVDMLRHAEGLIDSIRKLIRREKLD
jgi:hypothetical protein